MKSQPEAAHASGVSDLVAVAPELRADAIASALRHAGATIAEHHASDTATLHVLHGGLRARLNDRVVELGAGHLLPRERGLAHDVEAIAESAFVLVLARSVA